MGFWVGEKSKLKKFDTLNKGQEGLHAQLIRHLNMRGSQIENQPMFQQGSDFLSRIMSQDPETMRQFEAPMMRQFNEQIVPGLAERFSGMGARSSSAFNQTMGQAGASLSEQIAAMRANLGMGAAQQAFGYAQMPFQQMMQKAGLAMGTPTFGYQALEGRTGAGQGFVSGLGQAAGKALFGGVR
jgi:hypothetical protein